MEAPASLRISQQLAAADTDWLAPAAARAAYAELLGLWESADPEIQPLVDEVLARVEALGTD